MDETCQNFREELLNYWDATGEVRTSLVETEHYRQCKKCREFAEGFESFSRTLGDSKSSPVELNTAKMRVKVWDEIDKRTARPVWRRQVIRPAVIAPAMAIFLALSIFWLWPGDGQSPDRRIDQRMIYSYAIDALEPAELPESTIDLVAQSEFDESIKDYMLRQEDYSLIQEVYAAEDEWEQVLTELTTMQL